jgi:hypothetical protein
MSVVLSDVKHRVLAWIHQESKEFFGKGRRRLSHLTSPLQLRANISTYGRRPGPGLCNRLRRAERGWLEVQESQRKELVVTDPERSSHLPERTFLSSMGQADCVVHA